MGDGRKPTGSGGGDMGGWSNQSWCTATPHNCRFAPHPSRVAPSTIQEGPFSIIQTPVWGFPRHEKKTVLKLVVYGSRHTAQGCTMLVFSELLLAILT